MSSLLFTGFKWQLDGTVSLHNPISLDETSTSWNNTLCSPTAWHLSVSHHVSSQNRHTAPFLNPRFLFRGLFSSPPNAFQWQVKAVRPTAQHLCFHHSCLPQQKVWLAIWRTDRWGILQPFNNLAYHWHTTADLHPLKLTALVLSVSLWR